MNEKELTIAVRFTTDADGHITSITFPDPLPVMEIDYMQTFLSCLERAKIKGKRIIREPKEANP